MIGNEWIDLLCDDVSFLETGNFLGYIKSDYIDDLLVLIEIKSNKVDKSLFRFVIELWWNFNDQHNEVNGVVCFIGEVNLSDFFNDIKCLSNKF